MTETVTDAHNLYLETLSELGPVGLLLLVAALAVPVAAAVRLRRDPLVPALFGAYCVYLLHAAVDWDWELPALTLPALAVGAALVAASSAPATARNPRVLRAVAAVAIGTAAAFAFVGLVGNRAEAKAIEAARRGDWTATAAAARRAAAWAPWNAEPRYLEGAAAAGAGNLVDARAHLREAVVKDASNWQFWYWLSWYETGAEKADALAHARRLNPLADLTHSPSG